MPEGSALFAQMHPLQELIEAARTNSPSLKDLIAGGSAGLQGRDGVAVWGQEFLFAVRIRKARDGVRGPAAASGHDERPRHEVLVQADDPAAGRRRITTTTWWMAAPSAATKSPDTIPTPTRCPALPAASCRR